MLHLAIELYAMESTKLYNPCLSSMHNIVLQRIVSDSKKNPEIESSILPLTMAGNGAVTSSAEIARAPKETSELPDRNITSADNSTFGRETLASEIAIHSLLQHFPISQGQGSKKKGTSQYWNHTIDY
jgi:hypothetical protein